MATVTIERPMMEQRALRRASDALRRCPFQQLRFRGYRKSRKTGEILGVCALYALGYAIGLKGVSLTAVDSRYDLPKGIRCPKCRPQRGSAAEIIVHLNDSHRWSFSEIADWLESQGR